MSARNAVRLRGYLKQARKIPKNVREISNKRDSLSPNQHQQLKDFERSRSRYKEDIEVRKYSDGKSLFTVKQPANKIRGSYTVWEQQVDKTGKVTKMYKVTVGPKGEHVHTRVYKEILD